MESQDRFIRRWVLVALVYFVAAVSLGVIMAATHDYRLKGVHVHLNLLGWVSMALTAFVYRLFPAACTAFGARVHFWLYSTALPVMAFSLGGLLLGDPRFEPAVAASS
jgi:cbb3-type cytochrome oxidase subunit 1